MSIWIFCRGAKIVGKFEPRRRGISDTSFLCPPSLQSRLAQRVHISVDICYIFIRPCLRQKLKREFGIYPENFRDFRITQETPLSSPMQRPRRCSSITTPRETRRRAPMTWRSQSVLTRWLSWWAFPSWITSSSPISATPPSEISAF